MVIVKFLILITPVTHASIFVNVFLQFLPNHKDLKVNGQDIHILIFNIL